MSIFSDYEAQTERRYHDQEEAAAMGEAMAQHLEALLAFYGRDNFAQVDRALYKYTDCGAYLGLYPWEGDGIWSGSQRMKEVRPGDIRSIGVGSIVEGTDACPEMQWLQMTDYAEDETSDRFIKDFFDAVEVVEKWAAEIWDETHEEDENDE